jgi:hypothetical protein
VAVICSDGKISYDLIPHVSGGARLSKLWCYFKSVMSNIWVLIIFKLFFAHFMLVHKGFVKNLCGHLTTQLSMWLRHCLTCYHATISKFSNGKWQKMLEKICRYSQNISLQFLEFSKQNSKRTKRNKKDKLLYEVSFCYFIFLTLFMLCSSFFLPRTAFRN